MKVPHIFLCITLTTFLIIACGPSAEEISATDQWEQDQASTATSVALPTYTSTASATPIPTDTPTPTNTPTNTPTATPIPTSVVLPGTQVLESQNFDSKPSDWTFESNVHVNDGIASLDPSADWIGIFSPPNLTAGQTVLIVYQYAYNTEGHIAVDTGSFGTDSFRSCGVINNYGYLDPYIEIGETGLFIGWASGSVAMVPDQWYALAIYIGSGDEDFRIRLWSLDDPSVAMETHYALDAPATSLWDSKVTNAPTGSSMVDSWELIDGWPWPLQ